MGAKAKEKRVRRAKRRSDTGRFIAVDGRYVRRQAQEAFSTFFAPVSGAFKAAQAAAEPEPANDACH